LRLTWLFKVRFEKGNVYSKPWKGILAVLVDSDVTFSEIDHCLALLVICVLKSKFKENVIILGIHGKLHLIVDR